MSGKSQTSVNFGFNLLSLATTVGIGLLYTPFLVRTLGIAAYGLLPLSTIINQYIQVITVSLTGSLTRYYTVALQKNDAKAASGYLSSSLVALTVILLAVSPFLIWMIADIGSVFNIPADLIGRSRRLFIFTITGFFLNVYASQLNVSLYALNRLDLISRLKIVRYVLKVFLVVLLFKAVAGDVSYIGYSFFFAELTALFLSAWYFRRATKGKVIISFSRFRRTALMGMLSMMTWVIIQQAGDTGLNRVDLFLVNRFWGIRESGILGAVSQFGAYVTLITTVVSSLFGPLVLIAYGKDDHREVKKLAMQSALFTGLLTAVIVGLMCGFSGPILGLWLGREFEGYSSWFILKQLALPFIAAAGVFAMVSRAWNRIILPALLTLVFGILNLSLAYMLCHFSRGSADYISWVLATAALMVFLQGFGLNAWNFVRIYPDIRIRELCTIVLKIMVALAFTALVSFAWTRLFQVTSFFSLLTGLSFVAVAVVVTGYFALLTPAQRRNITGYFPRFNRNGQPRQS